MDKHYLFISVFICSFIYSLKKHFYMPGAIFQDKRVNKTNERFYYMILHNCDKH